MRTILENNIKTEKKKTNSDEKEALTAFSVIIAGIILFAIGIQVGKWSVVVLKALGV